MIPQKLQKTALRALAIFFLISPLQAFEFFNPFIECESETLKCVEGVNDGK